jgi:hypothetical protein
MPRMPTSRTIGGKLLTECYQEAAIQVNDSLKETDDLYLQMDGLSQLNFHDYNSRKR